MKKQTFKGSISDVIQELITLNEVEENRNLKIKAEVSAVRGKNFNNYYQILAKFLAEESGEVDFENLPRKVAEKEFEDFKLKIKDQLGYFTDYVTLTKFGKNIQREYISTADMTNKELLKFIESMENLVVKLYPQVNLDLMRRNAEY